MKEEKHEKLVLFAAGPLFCLAAGCGKDLPFEYEFEPDGDIEITTAGESYDIDSPPLPSLSPIALLPKMSIFSVQ